MTNKVLATSAQNADGLVVDVTSDLICPWCFVAKRRIERAAATLGSSLEIRWHSFELNPEMPVDGLDRRVYRSAKFGSWAQSQRLDAQVVAAGKEVGIEFRHDLMKRTPNTFKGHVLLAAAFNERVQIQNRVAERLFQAYFIKGEDVGNPPTLLEIAREFGVTSLSRVEDFDSLGLIAEVKEAERLAASAGIRGVPQITFQGKLIATGAQQEELIAASLRQIRGTAGGCEDGICAV
jgi:predicted DsbA family dithiol-disulfide isomerase